MRIEIITSINNEWKETGFGPRLACNNVQDALERLGHRVLVTECMCIQDLNNVVNRNPDLVILAAKYMEVKAGDNVWFSDFFSKNNIIFSGSNRDALRYDSDKVLAKVRLASLGIKTAEYFTATPGEYQTEKDLPLLFPLFVKPVDAANGNGVDDLSLVNSFSEFEAKVLSLYKVFNRPVLVEDYLEGQEFTVSVMNSTSKGVNAYPIELLPPLSTRNFRVLGAAVKKNNSETVKKVSLSDINYVRNVAKQSFKGLGGRGYGRIDIKMDNKGIFYFMEANLVPGMNSSSSYFPRACSVSSNMSYDDTIQLMFTESFERVAEKTNRTMIRIKT